jgi:hypothetical protein
VDSSCKPRLSLSLDNEFDKVGNALLDYLEECQDFDVDPRDPRRQTLQGELKAPKFVKFNMLDHGRDCDEIFWEGVHSVSVSSLQHLTFIRSIEFYTATRQEWIYRFMGHLSRQLPLKFALSSYLSLTFLISMTRLLVTETPTVCVSGIDRYIFSSTGFYVFLKRLFLSDSHPIPL